MTATTSTRAVATATPADAIKSAIRVLVLSAPNLTARELRARWTKVSPIGVVAKAPLSVFSQLVEEVRDESGIDRSKQRILLDRAPYLAACMAAKVDPPKAAEGWYRQRQRRAGRVGPVHMAAIHKWVVNELRAHAATGSDTVLGSNRLLKRASKQFDVVCSRATMDRIVSAARRELLDEVPVVKATAPKVIATASKATAPIAPGVQGRHTPARERAQIEAWVRHAITEHKGPRPIGARALIKLYRVRHNGAPCPIARSTVSRILARIRQAERDRVGLPSQIGVAIAPAIAPAKIAPFDHAMGVRDPVVVPAPPVAPKPKPAPASVTVEYITTHAQTLDVRIAKLVALLDNPGVRIVIGRDVDAYYVRELAMELGLAELERRSKS